MANYPTSDPSFPTRNSGDTITPAFFNDPNAEIVAIGSALRGTLQHGVTIGTGGLTVSTGNTSLGQNLSVAGNSTFAGPVTCSSGVTISSGGLTVSTGNVSLGQNLSVSGGSTLSGLRVAGQLRLGVQLSTLSGGSTRFDNVALASSVGVVMLSGNSTTIAISGISGGTHGRTLWLVNTMGGNDITLLNNDANSSADCRIQMAANTNKAFGASGSVQLVYSTHAGFWYGLVSRA